MISAKYIAGFVDGEGCITITKDERRSLVVYRPVLVITNTDKDILDSIAAWLGTSKTPLIIKSKKQSGNPNARPCYNLTIRGRAVLDFLPKFSDFLEVKKYQAEAVMKIAQMIGSNGSHYDEDTRAEMGRLYDFVKWLNLGCP